jgi:hypothetical protein
MDAGEGGHTEQSWDARGKTSNGQGSVVDTAEYKRRRDCTHLETGHAEANEGEHGEKVEKALRKHCVGRVSMSRIVTRER